MSKQKLFPKQRPEGLDKLVEIVKVQSTETSNVVKDIVAVGVRVRASLSRKIQHLEKTQ